MVEPAVSVTVAMAGSSSGSPAKLAVMTFLLPAAKVLVKVTVYVGPLPLRVVVRNATPLSEKVMTWPAASADCRRWP